MKIAIYSGSFNPIHIGHLALANYVCEYADVDEVWLLVSPQNPLKRDDSLLPEQLRLKWTREAVGVHPRIKVSDFEFALPTPSFTIDTLKALRQFYPEHTFLLLIGADNWQHFHLWRSSSQIIANHKVLVYPRNGYDGSIPSEMQSTVVEVNAPLIEVSSSFIRRSIAHGKNVRFFLPQQVNYSEVEFLLQKSVDK